MKKNKNISLTPTIKGNKQTKDICPICHKRTVVNGVCDPCTKQLCKPFVYRTNRLAALGAIGYISCVTCKYDSDNKCSTPIVCINFNKWEQLI